MSTKDNEFLTPVGRLLQGDAIEPQTKDQQGNPLTIKSGPNMGQLTQRFFVAIGWAKTNPEFGPMWEKMQRIARAAFPQHFNAQTGACTHPNFSYKYMDGDGVDTNGKPNASKEGFAGHHVLKFSSTFPPKCYYYGQWRPEQQITDKNLIKRGYFVRVGGTIEGNANVQKPGLYLNCNMIELCAMGPEIVSGPDAAAVFGAAAVGALPAGAIALPTGGAPAALPGMPAAAPVMPGAMVPGLPGMPTAAPAMPAPVMPGMSAMPAAMPVQPHPGILAAPVMPMPTMPGAMPTMPAPVTPAGPQMTAKAAPFTYEQMRANNWTDEALRANGYML